MKLYKNYSFLDVLAKAKERILVYLFLPYWKIRLGKIGKNSKVKRVVKIVGNCRRIQLGNNFTIFQRCF